MFTFLTALVKKKKKANPLCWNGSSPAMEKKIKTNELKQKQIHQREEKKTHHRLLETNIDFRLSNGKIDANLNMKIFSIWMIGTSFLHRWINICLYFWISFELFNKQNEHTKRRRWRRRRKYTYKKCQLVSFLPLDNFIMLNINSIFTICTF